MAKSKIEGVNIKERVLDTLRIFLLHTVFGKTEEVDRVDGKRRQWVYKVDVDTHLIRNMEERELLLSYLGLEASLTVPKIGRYHLRCGISQSLEDREKAVRFIKQELAKAVQGTEDQKGMEELLEKNVFINGDSVGVMCPINISKLPIRKKRETDEVYTKRRDDFFKPLYDKAIKPVLAYAQYLKGIDISGALRKTS